MAYTLTNKHNLPETIVNALKYDTHTLAGDISVTTLLDAPQVRILKMQATEIVEDVSDKIAALMGTALHGVLERANVKNLHRRSFIDVVNHFTDTINKTENPTEKKLLEKGMNWISTYMDKHLPEGESRYTLEQTLRVEVAGWTLSGTYDLYDKELKKLQDYKLTGVYTFMDAESRKKHDAQVNVYVWMLRQSGIQVDSASVVFFFKDWTSYGGLKNRDYPSCSVVEVPVKLYSDAQMTKYINERIHLHQQAEKGNIPPCTGKEKWASSDIYKVKQAKVKRSIKNFETEASAIEWIEKHKHSYVVPLNIEVVPGESKRCEQYCPVREMCPQRKKELELRNS